jgi:activator of HSP90 ATPase
MAVEYNDGEEKMEKKTMLFVSGNPAVSAEAPTRRQVLASAAIALGALALASTPAYAGAAEEISHTAESIHQETMFKASRNRIYEALLDTKQFERITQISGVMQSMSLGSAPTQINRELGGAFSLFGGHIVGRQVELLPNQRIVQAWRVVDWDPGVYSIAKFELLEQGSGTKLVFDHTGFPKGDAESLASGWKAHYWEPLGKLLA